ncbi:hypothetical protein Y048_5997 [Burkholderia pseudomallei MSHR456]|nr:hypothetical protein Y048_5997 [Burkholderia pseudomallei MSHR456]
MIGLFEYTYLVYNLFELGHGLYPAMRIRRVVRLSPTIQRRR